MPQNAAQVAEETQRRLGQKIYTTPPNTKDPYVPQEGDDTPAPSTPRSIFTLISKYKDKLGTLSENRQKRFYGSVFDKHLKPKLAPSGLDDKAMLEAREKFISYQMGGSGKLSSDFGKPGVEAPGKLEKVGAGVVGGTAKLAGLAKEFADLNEKLTKHFGDVKITLAKPLGERVPHKEGKTDEFLKQLRDLASSDESRLWSLAESSSPTSAKVGASTAEFAATAPLYEVGAGAGGALGRVTGANKLLTRALRGGAGLGAQRAGTTTDPQEIGKAAAIGAVASPILDPIMEGLSRLLGRGIEKVVGRGAPAEAPKAPTAMFGVTPEQQREAMQAFTRPKTEPPPKPRTKVEVDYPSAKTGDTAESSKWRQKQYVQLNKQGKLNEATKTLVREGHSAEDILKAHSGASSVGEKAAATVIAQQENPQVAKAVAATKAVSKVPGGVHGTGRLGKLATKAEKEAEARSKAAATQPSTPVGFEGSREEGGKAVPIAPTEVPIVELVSGLKGIKHKGLDGAKLAALIEGSSKFKGLPDVEKRAALEKTYQALGEKLGIEGAADMPLDELYFKLTTK